MARNSSPIRSAGSVCAALLAALLGVVPAGARAADFEACAPSPEVKAALDAIPPYSYGDQPYSQYSERKIASLRALRSRFPGNLFVERAYVESLARTVRSASNRVPGLIGLSNVAEHAERTTFVNCPIDVSRINGSDVIGRLTTNSIGTATAAPVMRPIMAELQA